MGVAVRMAKLADAAVLHEVAAATFPLACPPTSTQQDIDAFIAEHLSVERFREYLFDENRELLLVEKDDVPVGYTMLVYGEPSDADVRTAVTAYPTVELSKVYVLAHQHGTGAAAALLAGTINAARQRGAAGVWLGVNKENERANRFYERSGFANVGSKRFRLGGVWENDFVRELVF